MEIEVISTSSQFTLETSTTSSIEVVTNVPPSLNDLVDFDSNTKQDKYVLVYDSSTDKYKMVNPDEILNYAATQETSQPGLVGFASSFLDRLDVDLDNRIDIDGGTF